MTIKSMNELLAQADATIQDNATGDITAAEVRTMIKDLIDTLSPAYGAISCASDVIVLTATPVAIAPFTSTAAATPGFYTTNLTAGTVTRLVQSASLAGATDIIVVDGECAGPNNNLVTIHLYKNGAPTGFEMSVTCLGAGRPVSYNFVGLVYSASPGDAVYDIRVSGDAASVTFLNTDVLFQANPVRSFV
jgi:hypothetical protein